MTILSRLGDLATALVRRARGKRDVPEGAVALAYGSTVRPLLWVVAGSSVLEVAAVELIIPWPLVRVALLVVTVAGTLWILAFLAEMSVYPHLVTGDVARLRWRGQVDVAIPRRLVDSVGQTVTDGLSRTVQIDGDVLSIGVGGGTNLELRLRAPVEVDAGRAGTGMIRRIRFSADRPREALTVLRTADQPAG